MTFVFPGRVAIRSELAAGTAAAGVEVTMTGDADDAEAEVDASVEAGAEDVTTEADTDGDMD